MIKVEHWWICVSPVDMRKSIDNLTMHVMKHFTQGLQKHTAYVFCNRSGTRLKALLWDGIGFWLCLRRLNQGRFIWPKEGELWELNQDQFTWLSAGLDWKKWHDAMPKPEWL